LEYKAPVGMIGKTNKKQPITASKMVTWKSAVATSFKALQECVGHNRVSSNKLRLDRQPRRTRHPHGNISNKHNKLGVARLGTMTWQVGKASVEMHNQ
jgi:hypothetical protein